MPNLIDAAKLCGQLEAIATPFGFHVGIGGGCANKLHVSADRKDIDILLYRRRESIASTKLFQFFDLFKAFETCGLTYKTLTPKSNLDEPQWCTKATWQGFDVDILYPEAVEGKYNERPPAEFAAVSVPEIV